MKVSTKYRIYIFLFISILFYYNSALLLFEQLDLDSIDASFEVRETNNLFMGKLNGFDYWFEPISQETIQETKNNINLGGNKEDFNTLYEGHGTGLAPPSEEELNALVGKKWIKNLASKPTDSPPGASYDLSLQNFFPEVGNQQSQGSCSAWAITYYAFGYLEAKDHGWNASEGEAMHLMSPAWTFNKVSTSNYGSWMTTNAQIMVDWGCATFATMPYDDTDYYSWGDESAWREAPQHRPLDYYLIDFDEDNPNTTIDVIKNLILSETPITFAMHAGEFGPSFSDGNYIMSSTEYDSTSLNHAQTIVGFNDTISDDGDIGAFRVVNSWGTSFGDDGYYWITYDCLKEIGLVLGDFYIHLCVVTDRLDYQPSLVATWEFDPAPTRMNNIITLGIGDYNNPLEYKTPWYQADYSYSFPTFMTVDMSEYNLYYELDNNLWFYLAVGSSSTSGSISSFRIERFSNGILEEITNESRDIPQSNPGYVLNTFMDLDHDLKVILEAPSRPVINSIYTINTTIINNGIYNETELNVYLYLGGEIMQSKYISELLVGANDTIEYLWEPLDYGRYNFTGYTPPLIEEESILDNTAQKVLFIPKTPIFSGLYINHSCNLGTIEGVSHVSYNQSLSAIYNVKRELNISNSYFSGEWDVDGNTRVMENSSGSFYFGDGLHTPFWVFREIQLGDTLPIASRDGINYDFKVTDKIIHEFSGSNLVEVWVLQQLEFEGGIAYYETSTGILLNGTFINDVTSNDTYNFLDTNANFTYVYLPGNFQLFSDADSPDDNGRFTLTWNSSEKAIDYSVYEYMSYINTINGSLNPLLEHTTNNSLQLNGYSNGTYYFIVEARNDIGTITSNCLEVIVIIKYNYIQPGGALLLILGGIGVLATLGITIFVLHHRKVNRMK